MKDSFLSILSKISTLKFLKCSSDCHKIFQFDSAEISTGSNEIPGYFSGVHRSSAAGEQVPVSIKGLELINSFPCA